MPIHGEHSLISDADAFLLQREAIQALLEEDPTFQRAMPGGAKAHYSSDEYRQIYWQVESDGSIWPTLEAIHWKVEDMTGHWVQVYNAGREACMAAIGAMGGFVRQAPVVSDAGEEVPHG